MQNQGVTTPTNPPIMDLTGKIKTDDKGREYIDNPNMPYGREYLLNTNITAFDIYKRAAETQSASDEWLSGSPVQFYAPEGYNTKMNLETLKNQELREDFFAKQQSVLGLLGKSSLRGISSLLVGTFEDIGYLVNPNTYRALFGEEIVGEFENEFSRVFRELKESINDTSPIYRTIKSKSNDLWEAMFDATFWAGNAESIATTLSLMIPGMGMAKGISLLAKAAKLSKGAGRFWASIGSGLFSRVMESGMEAKEAFDSFIEGHKYDDRYINDETQLRLDAGKAASFTMQRNMPLFLIDAFQLDNIATGLLTFRNANNLTKKLINKAVDYGVLGLSEGAEEGTQFVIQKEGEYRSLSDPNVKKLMGETFRERWDKYTDDIEFQTSVLLGAVGGGLFKGTGSAARRIYNKALERIKAYKDGKTTAATNEDKKIFEILSDKEFEDQLMQHVKADSVDELLSLYEDQVKNLEGEEKSKVEDLISTIKAIQTSLPELKQFPRFKDNPKDALLFALVQNDQAKQNALNNTLNSQLEAEISSMNIEGQDTKDIALNLKLGAYKRVMDNLNSLKRINEVEKGKIKEAYKQHIDNLRSQIQGKINYQDIVSKNPALEDIAYKEEQNVVEILISNKIIEKLNEIKNNKTTTEETKTETKSEAKKEETKPKKEDIEQPEGDVFEEEITPEGPEQQIRIPEQKQEEQKKTPANKEPEQDTKQDEADKKASDESAPEKDIEETKIQKDDGEFDIEEEISTGLGRQDKEAPIIAESDQQIQASQIEGLADNIFNDISNIDKFPSYYTAREQAKQASTKNKLSEEVFDKLYKNEDKLLKDMDLDNPSSAQANALAARFSDLVRDGALGAVLKDALINKVPIDESILGDFIGAYNAMLKAVKGLQSSKQYGNVTPAPQIPDNVPVEEDNSQQADDVETEYNQTDPLRIVSFKYSYKVYTDSKGQKRVKTVPQTKQDSIKYNSYINFEETIKPEVAKVGSKIFFGIPEEFLQYQHNASDADILIYDENGNGISWLRRESTAKKWGASSEELNTLNKQRALLYSKATSYQGEPILINGKRVIPCNVSSNITSKSYGVITHDGDNYYPIKEALQTDNLDNIVLGVVIGNEAGGYDFHIPSVSLEDRHIPPADKFRTGHIYAMVQSANGDYFPLRLYTQKYSTLQKGTKFYNYYRNHMNEAFKKILSSDAKTSEQGSYELAKYVVLRLVKNNNSARPFKVQTYKDHKYEDTGEALTREEAIERVKNSLINIPYKLLNSKSPVMTELLNSDALQMNIFPGEPFHSPTFGFDQNLIDLKETKLIIEEVKEPTKETKIEEPIVKEEVTDPVEKSFEQNTTPEAVKELPSELPKKRGPLANPRSKLSMALKGKNFVKPDLSRRAEWGKDMGKYSLANDLSRQTWNQEKELAWLRKNLPQLAENDLIQIHKGLINVGNLYAWGRFKDGVITLSDIAASGTTYHEAFHAVFNMFLTEAETHKLLEKARKEFSLTGKSDVVVEETLADKFRDYVETDQITNKSILDRISDFFKNIYYLIKNKLHLNPTIEQVFYDINRGRYSKKKFEKNRPLVERNWLSNITPSVYKRRVDMLVDIFEDMIDNLANEYPELSRADVIKQYSLSDWILEIHDQLYASVHGEDAIYTNPEQIDAIDLITDELVEFDADLNPKFGQLALDMLKEISGLEGITFRATQIVDMDMNKQDETEEFMNNEETNKQEGWQIDQMLVSPVTKLRQSTRNIIRRIPKADASGNLLAPDDLGHTVYMSGTEVFATLLNKLSSMNKPSDLMKRLESLKTNFPWVGSIIDILKANPQVKVDFYNSFRNDSVEYMIINTQSDGTARVFAGNTLNTTDEILKVWSTNYSMLEHNKEGYVDSLTEMAAKIRKIYEPIPQDRFRKFIAKQWLSNWKSGTFSNPQVNGWAKTASEAMKLMGMDATPTELVKIFQSNLRLNDPRSNFEPAHKFLLKLYGSLNMFALILKKPEFNVNGDVYSEIEKTSFYAKIKALAKAVADVRPSLHESSLREGGKTYSSNITPSFIQKLFKRLTDVTDRSAYDVFKKSFFYTNNKGEITHPWLSSLLDARTKDRADEIRVGIFLQKDKVKYSELSKPDFLASKINLWANNNNRNYGYYMMPIPSDASSMPIIRFRKYEMRETISGLTELAKAEIRRIDVYNERKKLIKEDKILGIKNFDATFKKGKVVEGRGAKFLMFPFLNQYSLEELKNSEEKLTQYIIEAVDKGFEAFKANPDLDLNKVDKRMRLDQNLKEFYYNDLMAQYSIMTMTSGDLAYYKNDVDFFKRNKQNMSPGQYGDWESLGIPEKFKAIRMRDNEIPSLVADAYYENLVKNGVSHTEAMIIAAKFGYSNAVDENGKRVVKLPNGKIIESGLNNSTDGQTFITLDRYRNVARMNSKWDDAKEKSYQNLKNGTFTKKDILTFSLQPIKPYMFSPHNVDSGVEIDGKRTALYQPLQNKNSEAVLIPQMVQNSPLLSALVKGMEQNGIEAVYFESAVKEGIEVNTPKEIKDKLRAQGKEVLPDAVLEFTGDPNELSEANIKHYYLSNDDYMYQMDTPEHFKDALQLFGSQIRKHIVANLDNEAEFEVGDKKFNGQQITQLYDDIIAWNYDKNYKKVEDKIGTIEGLAAQLQSSVIQRKLAENTTEAVQLMNYKGKKVFKLPLYFPLQSNRIFQMASSIFRNNIIRNKVSGGAFYQATSFGYDDTLEVHMKDGHIEYVDCIVPYTYSKQLLELADENGLIDPDKVEDKELLKMICYRIPTEDKYSAVPLRIKGFCSPAEGGIIKLPSDILTITGSDLDRTMSN
jgi:hypothetical protein